MTRRSIRSTTAPPRRVGGSRTLATCGALGLAAGLTMAGVALAAPAHATTSAPLSYTCSLPDANGYTFSDPWTVTVDTAYPTTVAAGSAISTAHFNASITVGADAAAQLRALKVGSWSGSVKFSYAVGGDVATAGNRSTTLTVPETTLPASGPIVTTATGSAGDEQAGDGAGTATVVAGDFTAAVKSDAGVPVNVDCSLRPGQDATLASVQVTAPSATSSPTSSTSSTTTSSTSVTTGPPIITDGDSSSGSNDTVLAGLGAAVVGVCLLTAGARRRMRDTRK